MASTLNIIDTDTHLTEPPDLWTSRLPAKWGDQVMHARWDEARQEEVWLVGDTPIGGVWSKLAYGGRIADSDEERPRRRDDAHRATWDQAERVKLMDDLGIRAAVLYPNFGGLQARHFLGMANVEIAEAHLRAYNDFQVEWCANYPGRFVPMLVIPFWDVAGAVREIERTANTGFGGVVTTGAPHGHGQPYLGDPHWDPIWRACVDAGLSVSFHIGNGNVGDLTLAGKHRVLEPSTHLSYSAIPAMIENCKQVTDLLLSGVLVRFPTLKFVSVESGMGWVPFVLNSTDYYFKRARKMIGVHPWGDLLPSDLFRRQVYVNYWFEPIDAWYVELIGEDNILFETDFPHRACLEADDVRGAIAHLQSSVAPSVSDKIEWKNAAALYGLEANGR